MQTWCNSCLSIEAVDEPYSFNYTVNENHFHLWVYHNIRISRCQPINENDYQNHLGGYNVGRTVERTIRWVT